jgi:predicted Zn-dependent protease with MMP-like domain
MTFHPPTLDDIAACADSAVRRLPPLFQSWLSTVVFRVEEFATDDVLENLGLDSPYDLLGLYQGVHVGHKGTSHTGAMPDMVFLYRRPILDYWVDTGETLEDVVAHVLIHEVGHHFGLSDADMARIEASVS